MDKNAREVSSARSTQPFQEKSWGRGKPNPLDPHYITGFVDGEGCFCVSMSKHKTLKRRLEVRPEFEIEVRWDDRPILERIQATLGCGTIYDLQYQRYEWQPHAKYKVTRIKDLLEKVVPFFERYPLQAKKAKSFEVFKTVVAMVARKEHLSYGGFQKILKLRDQMRQTGKKGLGTARVRENRSPGGVGREIRDPNTARHVKGAGST